MEHRIVQLDLSSPAKPSFAVAEVFSTDKGQCVDYALNGACITAESPAQIASELELMLQATEKPVLLESDRSLQPRLPSRNQNAGRVCVGGRQEWPEDAAGSGCGRP
jgi:hypothetical protein